MDRVELDLTGPHISVNGLAYICTAMCSFTKFVVAWPIRDKKVTTVARVFMERVILPLGSLRELLTDNGKEFENELCHELCRLMGIEKLRTPQCNGGIERWHSTMNSLLAKNRRGAPKGLAAAPGIRCRRLQCYRPRVYGIQPELLDFSAENWLSRSTWLWEIDPPTDSQSTIMPITW